MLGRCRGGVNTSCPGRRPAPSRAGGTSKEAPRGGRSVPSQLSFRGYLCSSGRRRPTVAGPSTAPRSGPVEQAGKCHKATDAAEERCRAQSGGAASARLDGGEAARRRCDRPVVRRRRSPPTDLPSHQRLCVPGRWNELEGAPRRQERAVAPELPRRPLLVRSAVGRHRDHPAARQRRHTPPELLPHQRRRVLGPWDERRGALGRRTRRKGGVAPKLPGRPLLVQAAARRHRHCPAAHQCPSPAPQRRNR